MKNKTSSNLGSATVLVVDDQNASRNILSELLQNLSLKVNIVPHSNPQSALDWAAHYPADLVLVDYSMPDMNGIHFTRILRTIEAYRYIPIVMITIMDNEEIKQQALEAGVTEFLCKPLNLQECISRCRNLLSMQHQHVHLSEKHDELVALLTQTKQMLSQVEHETIQLLLHLIYREPAQLQRAQRVAHYARLLGEVYGLNVQEQTELEQASLLFEVQNLQTQGSKIATATELLSKSQSPLFRTVADITINYGASHPHHTKAQQQKSTNLPLSARIATITSFFDLYSFPSSKDSLDEAPTVAKALARLASDAGIAFDPNLVKQLISIRPRLEKVYEEYIAKHTS